MLYEHVKVYVLGCIRITTNTSSLHKKNNNERLKKRSSNHQTETQHLRTPAVL